MIRTVVLAVICTLLTTSCLFRRGNTPAIQSYVFSPRAFGQTAILTLAVLGLAVFVLAGLGAELATGTLLAYPDGADKAWILAIEAALTLSIAATLVLLFTGLPRRSRK